VRRGRAAVLKGGPRPARRLAWLGRLGGILIRALAIGLLLSVLQVLLARVVDPPLTLTMLDRVVEQHRDSGRWRWVDHRSRALVALGGNAARAAVASEDARFWLHHGFDLDGICVAIGRNQKAGEPVAGGSTISQQVARNVFLWQGRSWLRKGLEAWYTGLLELLVPKRRILELYLNVAETGPMTFGFESGAQIHFGSSAADLSPEQAARLAAILPAPRRWRPDSPFAGERAAHTLENLVPFPGDPGFDAMKRDWDQRAALPASCRRLLGLNR
jgi:monofunctional biosynthetic peptidoglycan transglycosylase